MLVLSTHDAKLYPMPFDDRWASRVLACSPPDIEPYCLFVFLRPRLCLPSFQPAPYGFGLTVRLRLASSASDGHFSARKTQHLPSTLAAVDDRRSR